MEKKQTVQTVRYNLEFPLNNKAIINDGLCKICPFFVDIDKEIDVKQLQEHYKTLHNVIHIQTENPLDQIFVQETNSLDENLNTPPFTTVAIFNTERCIQMDCFQAKAERAHKKKTGSWAPSIKLLQTPKNLKFWNNRHLLQASDFNKHSVYACDDHACFEVGSLRKAEKEKIYELTLQYGLMYSFDLHLKNKTNLKVTSFGPNLTFELKNRVLTNSNKISFREVMQPDLNLIKIGLAEIKNNGEQLTNHVTSVGKELANHVENVGQNLTNSVDALKNELNGQINKVSTNVESHVNLNLENMVQKMDELKRQVAVDFTTLNSLMDKINELEKERVFTRAFLDKTFLKVRQNIDGDYMMQYECPFESCEFVSKLKQDFKSHVHNTHENENLSAEQKTTAQDTAKQHFNCNSCCFSSNSKFETDQHIQTQHMQMSVEINSVFAKKTYPTEFVQDIYHQTIDSQENFDDIDTSNEHYQDTEQLLVHQDFLQSEPPLKKKKKCQTKVRTNLHVLHVMPN
jgi:uncharacterized protein YukE